MARSVFISYRHHQADFVRRQLGPVLTAAGSEVFIDVQRFTARHELVAQMDATQDKADVSLLVLTPDYLASAMCMHELDRAVASDPGFANGRVLPVVLAPCTIPAQLVPPGHLLRVHVDKDPRDPAGWAAILKALDATKLGTDAPRWLRALRECERAIVNKNSAVIHVTTPGANWRGIFEELAKLGVAIPSLDLRDGATTTRAGFVGELLRLVGCPAPAPKGQDLVVLSRQLLPHAQHQVLIRHLECAREKKRGYGADWVHTLRSELEKKSLAPIFHTHEAFGSVMESLLNSRLGSPVPDSLIEL